MSTQPTRPVAYTQSARMLYISDNGSSPIITFVPTVTFDDNTASKTETFFTSAGISSNGTAYPDVITTAQEPKFTCASPGYQGNEATPQICAGLALIRACKSASGTAVKQLCIVVEPDGVANYRWCDVVNVKTMKGDQSKVMEISWELLQNGPEVPISAATLATMNLPTAITT